MTVEPSEEPSLCRPEDHSSDEEVEEVKTEEVTKTVEANVIEAEANEIEDPEDDTDEQSLETALTEFYAD